MTDIIEASSVRVQTMADSTLRLTVDIDPRFANEAFRLFGRAGQPVALAALKTAKAETPKEPKRGLLSQWAAMRCEEPAFQEWIARRYAGAWARHLGKMRADSAAEVVREVCRIKSRAELDTDEAAAARFHELIREPWSSHCKHPETA